MLYRSLPASLTAVAALLAPLTALAQVPPAAPPAGAPAPADPPPAAGAPANPPPAADAAAAPTPEAAAPGGATVAGDATAASPGSAAEATLAPAVELAPAAPAPLPGAKPAESAAAPEAPLAKKLGISSNGYFQPSMNLQGWLFLSDTNPPDGPHDTQLTFRLRRAEFKAKGELIPGRIGYSLMIDAAKTLKFGEETVPVENQDPAPTDPDAPEQVTVWAPPTDTSLLQDVAITYLSDYVDVSVGQFKIPVSMEALTSASKLMFPERSLVSRTFGDRRDLGIKAEKQLKYFGYVVGVFNGAGQNRVDTDLQKDVGVRLEAYPIEGVMLGGVGYFGVGERDEETTKDRVEADLRVELEGALLQVEYIHGWVGAKGDRTEGQGAYAMAGYTFAEKYQPVARLGFVDTNVHEVDTATRFYELGFNYYILKHELKLQAAYALFTSDVDVSDTADVAPLHQATLAAQLAF